ncbi:MAG: LptF/LptG family permease [Phycisphaerales bacterium]|jgi:lipopolysaccharide export LptBFGC system permease protein LptF|nr:LptF/LptG family permease [Phycisphaerales bacterium]
MSRTLFWYIFKDLLRIFLLASGAIAAIMSFGGLLRPVTEHGLDAAQIGKILSYLMGAMTTYSLPIAALFATTMVYGRLAADNEITACRAGGISHLAMATPALLLGVTVAIISLLYLCFLVPAFLLKVEKVVYSNLASMVAHEIERSHQITLGQAERPITIFAQRAYVLEGNEAQGDQAVALEGPTIVTYTKDLKNPKLQVPRDFSTARVAKVFIHQDSKTGRISLRIDIEGGTHFPREFAGNIQGGIGNQPIGPLAVDSPIRFRPKFMDIFQLKTTLEDRNRSPSMKALLQALSLRLQRTGMMQQAGVSLNTQGVWTFEMGDRVCMLQRSGPPAELHGPQGEEITLPGDKDPSRMDLLFTETRDGRTVFSAKANGASLAFSQPDENHNVRLTIWFRNANVKLGSDSLEVRSYPRSYTLPVPEDLRGIESYTVEDYLGTKNLSKWDHDMLIRESLRLRNTILGELYSRASFSISCLILVAVGCALGMMFKSGNFLSAFAVSVIPALLCVTLIVAGQHKCENIPWDISQYTGIGMGIAMIWSGNAVVLLIAVALLGRLQRQ